MTDVKQIRHRHFVAIATGEYPAEPSLPDLRVSEEVEIIQSWLTNKETLDDRGFRRIYEELADNPTKDQIRAAFENPRIGKRWDFTYAAVVYITGHGFIARDGEHNRHFLVLSESETTRPDATCIATADLFRWLKDAKIEHLLIIVDVCFAGQVAEEVRDLADVHWLILPSATKAQRAKLSALANAINGFLDTGQKSNSSDPYLPVGLFVKAINDLLPSGQKVKHIHKGKNQYPDHDKHVCLPNPHYVPRDEAVVTETARAELALPKDMLALHNRIGGRLPTAGDQAGWLFTGRALLMRKLIDAAGNPGVTMVTGSVGSGKSTALSRLATLSDPKFREHYSDELACVSAELVPPQGSLDVAVSARGKSNLDVLEQFCFALNAQLPTSGRVDAVSSSLSDLSDRLASLPAPTIVVDALDEAEDSSGLARSLLSPLLQMLQGRLCLLIGVRSPGGRAASGEVTGPEKQLRELLTSELGAKPINVDGDEFWTQNDIETFVRNILRNTPNSPYGEKPHPMVAGVANAICSEAGRSYLLARVAAESLVNRKDVISQDDPAWLSALHQGLLGVFRDDLYVSIPSASDRRRGVALLRAVAFARGPGLPWQQVWPGLATAVDAHRVYGDTDVEWLLRSRLNAYLVTDRQDDLTVYRLLNSRLRETLKDQWRMLLQENPTLPAREEDDRSLTNQDDTLPANGDDIEAIEARIARQLCCQTAMQATLGVDQPPPPYVRRYLVEHALAGGVLDERHVPVPFLPYLDLVRLRAMVGASPIRRQLEEALPWLAVVRQVAHLWDWNRPALNAAAIEMWAVLTGTKLRESVGGAWQVRWAVRPPDMSEGSPGSHIGAVNTMAGADLSGVPVVVSGGSDGKLSIWDLSTGTRYLDREPIDTQGGAVLAVAIARLPDGRTVAVTGSSDGAVRRWDMGTWRAAGDALRGCTGVVKAVTAAVLPRADGRAVVAAADELGTVNTWDLTTGETVCAPLTLGEGNALGLASAWVGEQTLGLATGRDSGLQLWDLSTGARVGKRLTGHPDAQFSSADTRPDGRAISAAVLDGREVAIIGNDDGLLLWDLRDRTPVHPRLVGNDGPVWSLATIQRANGDVLGVTGGNGTLRMWDLTGRRLVGEPLPGHQAAASVEAIAVVELADDSVVAISGSRDGIVRLWKIQGEAPSAAQSSEQQVDEVEAIATARLPDGQAIAITAGGSRVQVWDLASGDQRMRLTGHDGVVASVAAAELSDDRGVWVIARYWDGTICTWSAVDGRLVSQGKMGLRESKSLATATLADGRIVALAGGVRGDVEVWDPAARALAGEPLLGHMDVVDALATTTTTDGRTLVISGSLDGHVRVRDLDAHIDPSLLPSRPPVDHETGAEVTSLAVAALKDGRVCVVVGGGDGYVRVLDLGGATVVGQPWRVCSGEVAALVAGQLDDGRICVFTGGEESLVQAWDASTGQPIYEALPTPGSVEALAFYPEPPSLVVGGAGVAVVRPRHGDGTGEIAS